MNVIPENPEEGDGPEPVQAEIEPEQNKRPWRKIVVLAGAGAGLVVAAVVVTLAATRSSAVRHNAIAYLNGLRVRRDWQESGFFDDDDYCPECDGVPLRYCPECDRVA